MSPSRSVPGSPTPASTRKKRQPVPYGHACVGCSQAKCKCKRSEVSVPCERCQRLGKVCEASRTPRKRGGGRPPNRTEQIEKRLDTLVEILQPSKQATNRVSDGDVASSFIPTFPSFPARDTSLVSPLTQVPNMRSVQAQSDTTYTSPTLLNGSSTTESSDMLSADLDPRQAQDNLRAFRTSLLPTFPALHIPSALTSDQLRAQRPYLWLTIQSLCCTPLSTRVIMLQKVNRVLAEQVAVQHDCSIDLLLAYILLGTWGTLYARRNAFYLGSTMAITLARNLKLDSSPIMEHTGFRGFAYASASGGITDGHAGKSVERTNEERRAVLACFCLSASTSHKLGTPPMGWTPYEEDHLRFLASNPECENDEVLIAQTRCARILNDICSASPYGFWGLETSCRLHGNIASTILAKPLKEHLSEVQSQISPRIQEKRLVRFWLLLTEIMILDLELQNPGPTASASLNFARAKSLQTCLSVVNRFFENFLSMKPQEHSGLHFHYWLHYMRCARVVYRFLLTEDPAWDSNTILESVDIMGALQRGAEVCKAIPQATNLESDGREAWTIFSTNLLRIRTIWTEALVRAGVMPVAEGAVAVEAQSDPFDSMGLDDFYSFDLFGDSWESPRLRTGTY